MESDKPTKLLINLREGIVQVEGDETFVRDVYNDFKEQVSKPVVLQQAGAPQLGIEDGADDDMEPPSPKARTNKIRRTSQQSTTRGETAAYKPEFNTALDLSGLPKFYDQYDPTTHPEKILIFATFLKERLNIAPCTANDIFTCYSVLKTRTKTPGAFLQAFRDTQNKTHFIEYLSPTEINLTIAGTNYLNFDMKKKGAAE